MALYRSRKRRRPKAARIKVAKRALSVPVKKNTVAKRGPNPLIGNLAGMAGTAIGDMIVPGVGGAIGGRLARGAHSLFHQITGLGDYKINKNSLVVDQVPEVVNSARQTRVKHREYIMDVITSSSASTFNIQTLPINPGLSQTFPWLSQVAENYEEYKIHGMIFEYKTTSSDALNSTNTALGSVMLATQYNSVATTFQNKQQMDNYEFAVSTKPSISILHPIECEARETPMDVLYVRSNTTVVANVDIRLYDLAKFSIATTGMQGTSVNVGELWVSYDIELLKPRMSTPGVFADDHFLLNANVDTSHYFGATVPVQPTANSNFGCKLNNTQIIIPSWFSGIVYITYYVNGGSVSLAAPTLTPSAGASAYDMFVNGTQNNELYTGTPSGSNFFGAWSFSCVSGGIITFSGGTLPSSSTTGDLFVMSVPQLAPP